MGKTKRGKGNAAPRQWLDRTGLPLAVRTERATPHEVTLVAATLEDRFGGGDCRLASIGMYRT